ncbi:MAG: GHKL domain-containing protein [Candidatus Limivivens sp.]|nr:GHKL domain-containing protein [Candidatus Limivivens sp.]
MLSDILSSLLYGFLFCCSMNSLQPHARPVRRQGILFLSTALYLYLTRLSGEASLFLLLVYGVLFTAWKEKEKLLSFCCSMAGFAIFLAVSKTCLFFTRDVSLPDFLKFLPHLGIFLISVPALYFCGHRLRLLFTSKAPALPADFLRWILAWLLGFSFLLLHPWSYENPLILAAVFALSAVLLYRLCKLKLLELQGSADSRSLETLARYTENLETANLELRRFKHDYANILSTLSGYIEQGNILGLKAYFQEQILPMSSQMQLSSFDASALSAMQIPEVKSLLITKILSEKARGLKIKIQIASPISWMVMDTGDFCRILGIYLDNALEGAAESEKKELQISLDDSHEGHSLVILNSCDHSSLPLDRLEHTDFSTKGEGHGMGLATVSEILKKHPYVYRRTLLKDGYFIQQLDNF